MALPGRRFREKGKVDLGLEAWTGALMVGGFQDHQGGPGGGEMTGSTGILGNQEGLPGMDGSQGLVKDMTRKVSGTPWGGAAVKTETRNLEFYSK